MEGGSWKLGGGRWKLEVGSWKLEVGNGPNGQPYYAFTLQPHEWHLHFTGLYFLEFCEFGPS